MFLLIFWGLGSFRGNGNNQCVIKHLNARNTWTWSSCAKSCVQIVQNLWDSSPIDFWLSTNSRFTPGCSSVQRFYCVAALVMFQVSTQWQWQLGLQNGLDGYFCISIHLQMPTCQAETVHYPSRCLCEGTSCWDENISQLCLIIMVLFHFLTCRKQTSQQVQQTPSLPCPKSI